MALTAFIFAGTQMLSPHEFATLMLVRHAPDQLDMNRAELDALLERQLVMLEHRGEGARRVSHPERESFPRDRMPQRRSVPARRASH
jgi:hypothetical protein